MDILDKEGQKRWIIVGGGFDGLKLARKLKRDKFQILRKPCSTETRYWTALNRPRIPVIKKSTGV